MNLDTSKALKSVKYNNVEVPLMGELNVAYGLAPPADTSKLWVRIADKPNNVQVEAITPFGHEAVEAAPFITPGAYYTWGLVYCNGAYYIARSAALYKYNPTSNSWSIVYTPGDNHSIGYACGVAVVGKKIVYLFGHTNNGASNGVANSSYTDIYSHIFDTETQTGSNFQMGGYKTEARQCIAATSIGETVYATGGQIYGNNNYANLIYAIDISVNPPVYTQIGKFGVAASFLAGTCLVAVDNKLYARRTSNSTAPQTQYLLECYDLETSIATTITMTLGTSKTLNVSFLAPIVVGKYIYWLGGVHPAAVNSTSNFGDPASVDYAQRYNLETGEFDLVTVGSHKGITINTSSISDTKAITAEWKQNIAPWIFTGAYELENGKLLIQESLFNNIWQAFKAKNGALSVGVNGVYLGGTDGYAQAKDAYLYDTTQQKWISLDGTPFGGVTPEPTPTPTLEGTWVLNDTLVAPGSSLEQVISGTIVTAQGNAPLYSIQYVNNKMHFYISAVQIYSTYDFDTNQWANKVNSATFPSGATASDNFITWLAANATKQ